VTICTRNRSHFFGEILDNVFIPTPIGHIAENHWREIPDRFPYVRLGEHIIMPNHVHGIVTIRRKFINSSDVETRTIDFSDVFPDVETRLIASLRPEIHQENDPENISKSHRGGITGLHNPMLHQNLSRVIRWYTGRVSYESHKINPEFNWQRRFHDRIIRDIDEYKTKTRYIRNNILNWKEDEFY
jgi:putative transposase